MKVSPLRFTMVIMGVFILIFSEALRVFEAPLARVTTEMNLHEFGNAIWVIILTMTTGTFFWLKGLSGVWRFLSENDCWQSGDFSLFFVRGYCCVSGSCECNEHARDEQSREQGIHDYQEIASQEENEKVGSVHCETNANAQFTNKEEKGHRFGARVPVEQQTGRVQEAPHVSLPLTPECTRTRRTTMSTMCT